jgi:uncharacterized protein YceH (UPF0502 family)
VLELSPEEIRILGCLVEKQRTTPDGYPLSVNALRLACNQSTNRDPVVDFDETTVRQTAQELGRKGLARFTSGQGSRTAKYRHVLDEKLGLDPGEASLVAVLMLRGPQTPGELKTRTDRMHGFGDLAALQATLTRLTDRDLVARFPRRPGQKEDRYAHRLGIEAPDGQSPQDTGPDTAPTPPPTPPAETPTPWPDAVSRTVAATTTSAEPVDPEAGAPSAAAQPDLESRVARLEAELERLKQELGV